MLEFGSTPILPPAELEAMGYTVAAYPLTLLSASVKAMQEALRLLAAGKGTEDLLVDFQALKQVVGFSEYDEEQRRVKERLEKGLKGL